MQNDLEYMNYHEHKNLAQRKYFDVMSDRCVMVETTRTIEQDRLRRDQALPAERIAPWKPASRALLVITSARLCHHICSFRLRNSI